MDDVPFCSGQDKEQKGVGLHYEHSLELLLCNIRYVTAVCFAKYV